MKTFNKILIPMVLILFAFFLTGCPNPNTPEPDPDPDVTIPAAPTALIATVESDTAVSLAWTDNADNETGFVIEWSKTNDFATIEDTATPTADVTTLVATGLDASNEYFFRIKAVNSAGDSTYAEASATTDDPPVTIPAAPSAIVLTVVSDTEIDVAWTDNSSDETGFELQWDTVNTFATYDDETPGTNETTASVTGLTANTEYFFRIRAVNSAGSSAWSAIESETTNPTPAGGTFYINANATYTTSTSVTLNSNITNVVQMRFGNDLVAVAVATWVPYAPTKSYTLPTPDGTKTVYAQYKNSVGDILEKSDSIILDRVAPSGYIQIDGGATYATSTNVTINNHISGATQMKHANSITELASASWITYTSTRSWTLPSTNGTRRVYAQFKDAAGNVKNVYDDITLDTVAPTLSSFYINSGNPTYTNSTYVTLYMNGISGATQMRYHNSGYAPTTWQSLTPSRTWTLPISNGTKYVYVELRDAAGNIRTYSDYITLDTVAPTGSIKINTGAANTYSTYVTINNYASSGTTSVRYRNAPSSIWSPWYSYASTKTWDLTSYGGTPTENATESVYAQFRDAAGNLSINSYYDGIKVDMYRRLKITAEYIYVDYDGDLGSTQGWTSGAGEIYWGFYGYDTSNTYFTIYNQSSDDYILINSDNTYNFADVSKIVTMRNGPGKTFNIRFMIGDKDGPSTYQYSDIVMITYGYDSWGIGGTRYIETTRPDSTKPLAKMYYNITYLD